MTIQTGVSPSLLRPQTFHTFTFTPAVAGLTPLPLNLGLIGAMRPSGATAVAGTVYEIDSVKTAETLFGASSELALMCRKYFETCALHGKGPRLFAVGIAEPGAGTANVKTITATGTATADSTAIIDIAGRIIMVGVRTGDVQNTVGAAVGNALKAVQDTLPVIPTQATNVVTLTHPTKGINGGDVKVTVLQQPVGTTLAVANTAVGAGVTDHQAALDAFAPMPIDAIGFANHYAADVTEINADIAARWSYSEKKPRWYFVGEPGTIGTATALAAAANHTGALFISMEGCRNTAGEMAAFGATAFLVRGEQPNATYNGMKAPLTPPDAATIYTGTEVETAIAAGLTPLTARVDPFTGQVVGNMCRIERMVTSKTTQGGLPYDLLRDVAVARVGWYLAKQYDVQYEMRWGGDADPNGALSDEEKPGQIKDMIKAIHRSAGNANPPILKNVEADLELLKVEPAVAPIGRYDAEPQYTPVLPTHQIAFSHRVRVGT